jgi:hypothetical protein
LRAEKHKTDSTARSGEEEGVENVEIKSIITNSGLTQKEKDEVTEAFGDLELDNQILADRIKELEADNRDLRAEPAVRRDTTRNLFLNVFQLVQENGHYEAAKPIMDYVLPNRKEPDGSTPQPISNYRFNFRAMAYFGGSEGIYIDCFLEGSIDEKTNSDDKRWHIGTFKTLREDLTAMKIMGELAGAMTFYADRYISKNMDRYTPTAELNHE